MRESDPAKWPDAREALDEAIRQAPARPTIRMHRAWLAAMSGEGAAAVDARLSQWHAVAPHDGQTQPWRVALGVSAWEGLSPATRALVLADVEDLCVRSGRPRTERLVLGQGSGGAHTAALMRLARMERPCAGYSAAFPDILTPGAPRPVPPSPPANPAR